MPERRTNSGVLVIGLGRFGSALAITLERSGREVLAVEKNPDLIEQWSGRLPLVEADATNPESLEQLGASEFPVAVVGVGTSLEASVLITGNLVDLGMPEIWAKAISAEHGRILRRIGAHHVVYPEHDAGQRVAHMVSGRMLDFIEMEDGFTIVKMRPPRETWGFTLAESDIRRKYGITVIGVKPPGEPFEYSTENTRINRDDILIVSGNTELLERFAQRP
ncbi:potassium channel family protein [Bowdeniella massiliensis]|uniref:potassium channel family protein n=1 Tax=Bowdeniella massiliensis TaxID=2932264 RepID=UPI002028147C|nr:TrkA family potassium uptake protein [Bowdeniella massiliensis]